MENIEWDKLETRRTLEITITKYAEKILQEGVYACPHCMGTGKAEIGHSFRDGPIYTQCGMCKGTGEIRKCPVCSVNSVPNIKRQEECIDCFELKGKRLREEFMERTNKGDLK